MLKVLTQLKIFTKIKLAHLLVFRKFIGCTCFQYAPFVKKVGSVGYAQGFMHIMIRNENADVFFFQFFYDGLNVFYGNRVNTGKRLIQLNKFRIHS